MIDAITQFWLSFEKALQVHHTPTPATGTQECARSTYRAAYTTLEELHKGKDFDLDTIKALDAQLRLNLDIPVYVLVNHPWIPSYTHTISQGCAGAIITLNNRADK